MKRIILILIVYFFFRSLFGQSSIQGFVFDSITLKPLSFATLGAVDKNYGCYTDTTGFFTLYFSEQDDSIKVSFLGYANKNITIKELLNNSQILLNPTQFEIEEVYVRPENEKYKQINIGYFSKKYNTLKVLRYPVNVYSIHIPIPESGKEYLIESVNIAYSNSGIDYNLPIRVLIISVDRNGEPGNTLLSRNIELTNKKTFKLQKTSLDISDERIFIPDNGIFVAIEWLVNFSSNEKQNIGEKFGPYIGTTKTIQNNKVFLRVYNQENWHIVKSNSMLNIGLTVKVFD